MNKYKTTLWAVRVILIALIVCHMSVIYGFSSDTGVQSQSLSDKITIQVVHILNDDYDTLKLTDKTEYFNDVSFIIRKIGHFGEYAILGILIICFLITFKKLTGLKHNAVITIVITTAVCLVYAITDELHQGFVDGRSPRWFDVGIDTVGAITGAGFVFVIYLFIRRKQNALGE